MNEQPELFFPSNGTEGAGFIGKWCERCVRDTYSRCGEKSCSILMKTILGKSVKQWVYIDKVPTCTSFVEVGSIKKTKKARINKRQITLEL